MDLHDFEQALGSQHLQLGRWLRPWLVLSMLYHLLEVEDGFLQVGYPGLLLLGSVWGGGEVVQASVDQSDLVVRVWVHRLQFYVL